MSKKLRIKWLGKPEKRDYPAAETYLSLIYEPETVKRHVKMLKTSPTVQFRAVDLFRASGLSFAGDSARAVEVEQKKIRSGAKLSPLLLVRDPANGKLVIADGYHRLCAIFLLDQDAPVPCRIV